LAGTRPETTLNSINLTGIASKAVSHRPETETALAFLHCRISGRKTGFHFS
jgi:hypothetical protein